MQAEKTRQSFRVVIQLACVLIPLFVGAVIYLIFDPHTIISARVYPLLPDRFLSGISVAWKSRSVFRFCRNYLCDFCWAFSLESSVILLLGCTRRGLFRSVGISFLLSFLLEIMQKTELISGTFDPADTLVEAAAILMAGFIQYYLGGKGNEKMGSRNVSGDGIGAVRSVRARKRV